jgi:dCMP deaminase
MGTETELVKVTRPSWDKFWFTIAMMYSTRGTCDRLRTATVVVKNNRLVSAGYNGSPPGADHCDDIGHLMINGHCERTIHGEANAVINADRNLLKGAEVYILGTPCLRCANELIGAGVTKIHCLGKYETALGSEVLNTLARTTSTELIYHDYAPEKLLEEALVVLQSKGGILHKKS